jgi:hypothetical protein
MPLIRPKDAKLHVFPIYKPDREKPDRPTIQGSAFWVTVDHFDYVVTANHVLDQTDDSSLYWLTGDMLLIDSRDIARTGDPPYADYTRDPYDLAVFRPTPLQVDGLKAAGKRPIAITDWVFRPKRIDGIQLVFTGYPATKLRLKFSEKKMKPELHTITSQALTESEIAANGWKGGLHMLVGFDRKRMVTDSGKVLTAPEPYGMSGGAVFAKDRDTHEFHVLGVGIYYDNRKRYLVATPMGAIVKMLYKKFPETRPFLGVALQSRHLA